MRGKTSLPVISTTEAMINYMAHTVRCHMCQEYVLNRRPKRCWVGARMFAQIERSELREKMAKGPVRAS